ncbi:tetratricopeptide repeat protein [Engelhardtia mirabilis]
MTTSILHPAMAAHVRLRHTTHFKAHDRRYSPEDQAFLDRVAPLLHDQPDQVIALVEAERPDWKDEGDLVAHFLIGIALHALCRHQEAEPLLEFVAAARRGTDFEAASLVNLGEVKLMLGDRGGAQELLYRAISLEPSRPSVLELELLIASFGRDEVAVESALERLESDLPMWKQCTRLIEAFATNTDLAFARQCPSWGTRVGQHLEVSR